jgi:hypothetical protein
VTYALDERRADDELPAGCDAVCPCCALPCAASETLDELCPACRCAACGSPARLEERDGVSLCELCAIDAGWCPSVALELEAAE